MISAVVSCCLRFAAKGKEMFAARAVSMGALLCLLALGAGAAPKQEPPLPPQPLNASGQLTEESAVKLITLNELRSGRSKKGERIRFIVDDDVVDSTGAVLIRKGTPAYGTVTASRNAGYFGKRGLLDISIEYTTAADGQRVPLRAIKSMAGKSKAGVSIAVIVLLSPLGFFIRGRNITVKEGTQLLGFVDQTMAINVNGNGPTAVKLLILTNGNRITGRLQGPAGGVYTLLTDNGPLKIKEADIREIEDAPVTRE